MHMVKFEFRHFFRASRCTLVETSNILWEIQPQASTGKKVVHRLHPRGRWSGQARVLHFPMRLWRLRSWYDGRVFTVEIAGNRAVTCRLRRGKE